MSDTLALGLVAAGLFVSLAALLAVLFNDWDWAHRDARSRNQAHPMRKRGHR